MMKQYQPPTHQASIGQGLSPNAERETDENTPVQDTATVPDTIRSDVDPTTLVFIGYGRYHVHRCGVSSCPEQPDRQTLATIAVAAREQLPPCLKCCPVDYRIEDDQSENATLEAFL